MTDKVPSDKIEEIVGVKRHTLAEIGRSVTAEETFYILHSKLCCDRYDDLRDCPFSLALDNYGIDPEIWDEWRDQPVVIGLVNGKIAPMDRLTRLIVEERVDG